MNYYLRIIIFILVSCLLSLVSYSPSASAQTMSNSSYILKMGNFNTVAGEPTGPNYKLNITGGQTSPGLYSGTNYKVKVGFQYITRAGGIPFAFSISETLIDFGTLNPTNPITRSSNLTVSNGASHGYSVTAYENHQLQSLSQDAIPDTTCDNGSCSETTSSPWTSTLTYGFGYRCDNVADADCSFGFSDPTYYKQFADNSRSEASQAVMSSVSKGTNKQSKITYKVNISGTQTAGNYSNAITFILTPNF